MADVAPEEELHPIGRLAAAAGVTTQTIRLWEKRGRLVSVRTPGGQRLFSDQMLRRAAALSAASKRNSDDRQKIYVAEADLLELASTGARIRQARLNQRMSQEAAARQIGISRSFLSAVERGSSGVSTKVLAKMADVFQIPMSGFAERRDINKRVMRVAERPRTVLAGGVVWEELVAPNSHDLEPALLKVPAGGESGGVFVRPGEVFVFVQAGSLSFRSGEAMNEELLNKGDAIILDAGMPFSWSNTRSSEATLLWIELIGGLARAETK